MFMALPVFAAATNKSVCLQRNAGIWSTSTYWAASGASAAEWISVTVGMLKWAPTFCSIFRALRSPIPVNESNLERFAFRYDPLNINGISSDSYPTPAKRPRYSLLDKSKIKTTFNIKVPFYENSLEKCIKILKDES